MATDVTALAAAIKLVCDGINDTEKAVAAGGGVLPILLDFDNLLPDLFTVIPTIGQIPAEVAALQPVDYATLIGLVTTDLGAGGAPGNAANVIAAALKVLNDLTGMIPDITALVAAIKTA